jgi:hypothetical protein
MRFSLALVTALVVAGCVGDIPPDTGGTSPDGGVTGGSMARTMYKNSVHTVMNRCSGGACHSVTGAAGGGSSRFADSSADTSYDAIVRAPLTVGSFDAATAGVLTKVAAGHNGVTYTSGEISSITSWLSQEKTWSGCMTIANFNTAQMAQKWGSLAAGNNQKCLNCHGGGLYGFMLNDNAQTFFGTISTQKDYLLKYFTVDGTGKVIINMASMTNAGVTIPTHPHFDPVNNLGMPALQAFYDSTLAASTAGTCGPSTLTP